MPAIKYNGPDFTYDLDKELLSLRQHQVHRGIPEKRPDNMLLASWNLCNLGDVNQQRQTSDLALMAEILRPFDLIAVQEIKDDFRQFRDLVHLMGPQFDFMITDKAGNDERLGFIFDTNRVQRLQLVGELVVRPDKKAWLKVRYKNKQYLAKFTGFNRNPYIASFRSGQFAFTLTNVHILYGRGRPGYLRRVAEVYKLASWAHKRVTEKYERTFDHDIILIGDFNIPKATTTDAVGKQLMRYGMHLTLYGSQTGSNLAGTDHFDQIAFHPGHTGAKFNRVSGVFDFDKALFSVIHQGHNQHFKKFTSYHISDHRLIWSEWHNMYS